MNAVKLAYIYQREGREREATLLLTKTLDVIRDLPRLGTWGYGIRDVHAYALLGRHEDAINAFREAIDAGYRGSVLFDGFPLAVDPYLDGIRDDPRFEQMLAEVEDHLAVMRDRIDKAEASGDLGGLRAMAEII
jgi:tetratricopeptide (TPR) repeat protein